MDSANNAAPRNEIETIVSYDLSITNNAILYMREDSQVLGPKVKKVVDEALQVHQLHSENLCNHIKMWLHENYNMTFEVTLTSHRPMIDFIRLEFCVDYTPVITSSLVH